MTDAELRKALETEESPQLLPLVVEILPGQAAEGLIDIYEPGSLPLGGQGLETESQ